jgi:hypothetical protein
MMYLQYSTFLKYYNVQHVKHITCDIVKGDVRAQGEYYEAGRWSLHALLRGGGSPLPQHRQQQTPEIR